jgi:ABC-type transport system involved in Fe-S cluster assembly fused permease/ATPase subunit
MMQRSRIFLHFVTWCLKNIVRNIAALFSGLLVFPKFIRKHYEDTKSQFRQSFSYGMLNCVLSQIITFGMTICIGAVMFGGDLVLSEQKRVFEMIIVSQVITASFYVVCYVSVLYEKFLSDYERVFTILKEKDNV